jgi:hypothetical protein
MIALSALTHFLMFILTAIRHDSHRVHHLSKLAQTGDELAFSTLEVMATVGNTLAVEALKNCTSRVVGAIQVDPDFIIKPNAYILPGERPPPPFLTTGPNGMPLVGQVKPVDLNKFDDTLARSFAEAGTEIEDSIFEELKRAENEHENAKAAGKPTAEADSSYVESATHVDEKAVNLKDELVTSGKVEAEAVDTMEAIED